jgi:hypothetical protein
MGSLAASGLPVSFEATGGEPTESEARELNEAIQGTYAECRGQDVLILRRLAAITNRAGEAAVADNKPRPFPPIDEYGYGALYRDEIEDAFKQVEPPDPVPTKTPAAPAAEPPKESADAGTDED